jgi:hypothetical protein
VLTGLSAYGKDTDVMKSVHRKNDDKCNIMKTGSRIQQDPAVFFMPEVLLMTDFHVIQNANKCNIANWQFEQVIAASIGKMS